MIMVSELRNQIIDIVSHFGTFLNIYRIVDETDVSQDLSTLP